MLLKNPKWFLFVIIAETSDNKMAYPQNHFLLAFFFFSLHLDQIKCNILTTCNISWFAVGSIIIINIINKNRVTTEILDM